MKVIFLDVDGVLNGADWKPSNDILYPTPDRVNPACRERLLRIVELTGAGIVLSTSLRNLIGYEFDRGKPFTRNELLEILGIPADLVVGITPDLEGRTEAGVRLWRGHEIHGWLNRHPEVTAYVILEDEADPMMPAKGLIETSYETGGLLEEHVAQVVELLNA